ncbi:MAG: tyrosine-type recombinase/integrase, partial [Brevinema sp.]
HEKKRLDFPKQPKKKIQRNLMADQDFHRLLNYFKRKADWDFMLYMIFIYQFGNRLNEIPQLKHSHIDLERLSIVIPTPKRNKEKNLTFSQKFKEIIAPLLTHAKVNSPYIFYGHDKHKDYYANRFKKIRGRLNLNKAYTLRDFRYTAGNRLLEETGDIYKVSGLLGHSKISTTQEAYIAPQKSVHTTIIDDQISQESVASFEFWGMSIALGNPEYTRGLSKFEQQEILLGFLSLSFLHYLDDKGIQRIYEPFSNLEDTELAYRSECHIDDNIVNICIYTLLELYPKIDKLCKDKKILGYSLYEEIGKASYSRDFTSKSKYPTQDVIKIFDELISLPIPTNKVQKRQK